MTNRRGYSIISEVAGFSAIIYVAKLAAPERGSAEATRSISLKLK